MLYRFIILFYGATLLQNVFVQDASSTQTIVLQQQILDMLAPHIISNTSEEVCLRYLKTYIEPESCFSIPSLSASDIRRSFVEICLSLNFAKISRFILHEYYFKFKSLEYYMLAGCLYLLPSYLSSPIEYADYIRLLYDASFIIIQTSRLQELFFHSLAAVRNSNWTFTHIDADLIFKAWRPFSTDVKGMVAYTNQTYLNMGINSSLAGIDDSDLDVSFYLEVDFLNKLIEKFTVEEKLNLRLVILLIKNELISESISFGDNKIFGIDFGGICINNELKMIRIQHRTADQSLIEGGYDQKDFDPLGCDSWACSFPRMLFIKLGDQSDHQEFCPRLTTPVNLTRITWSPAPKGFLMFPLRFCLTKDCNIPMHFCGARSDGTSYTPREECHNDYYISSEAEQQYEYFKCCDYYPKYCRKDFNINTIRSYADAKISMLYIDMMLFKNFEREKLYNLSADVLDRAFNFLAIENGGINRLYCMLSDIQTYNDMSSAADAYSIKKENYVYVTSTFRNRSDTIGFVFYKNNADEDFSKYDMKYITDKNVSYDYSTDDAVEIIIYLPIESRNQLVRYQYIKQRIFVLRNSDFIKNSTLSCRSRIVVIDQFNSKEWENTPEFTVYLKTIEDGSKNVNMFRREGYWFTIIPNNEQPMAFCLSELIGNVCNTVKQVITYTFTSDLSLVPGPIEISSTQKMKIQNVTITPLDMLSQLAISMNPRIKRIFQDYFQLFHVISITESTLSAVGLFFIILSAVILKGWCERKFNTVQLSITLSLEIAFFLIDVDKITHIGYLIFYYSILVQFAWMLIIGYHQYLKFVKVLTSSSINKAKSLILAWFGPALIMLLPLLIHPDCLKCHLCYKNEQIFNYFVIGPVSLIIITNLIIYFAVMYNIFRIEGADISGEMRKAKIRAAILFPFLLGISWISIFALYSPWSWISIGGSFMFYIVTPSQGFVLFVFTVLLDNETVVEWRRKFSDLRSRIYRGMRKRENEEIELKMA